MLWIHQTDSIRYSSILTKSKKQQRDLEKEIRFQCFKLISFFLFFISVLLLGIRVSIVVSTL
jgi:hypothetical protein